MKLLIAMPAPGVPESGEDASGAALPALTRLLQQARPLPGSVDWRDGVLRALGVQPGVPAVSVAAQAVPALPRGAAACFATPLHVVAGISRVHLPPGGRLALQEEEAAAWREAFDAQFAGDGIRLHDVQPGGHWLLEAPFANAARDAEPALLIGEALERRPADSAPEKALRRLGAEVEMWLAAHPLNRARERARLPPLTALWFWAGAVAGDVAAGAWRGQVVSSAQPDAWLCGLSRLLHAPAAVAECWGAIAPLPHALAAASAHDEAARLLVIEPEGASMPAWKRLEEHWFEPVVQALDAGVVSAVRLQIGAQAWQGPDRSALRWLRRGRGRWWEMLEAARA